MKKLILVFFAVFAIYTFSGDTILKLATTTSTYETGLLDSIIPPFEKQNGVKVHVISVGTGKAIRLGENGDVDVILVHARNAEDKFVAEGYGVKRYDVMYNDFVIAGPESDPAGLKKLKTTTDAMKVLADSKVTFVSRGDDSGTHKKEKGLWEKAGINPENGSLTYLEAGQGMSATLRIADEKQGYVLVDRASYLFALNKITLKIDFEKDKDLLNYYGVIAVNPEKHNHVNIDAANAFINWLVSDECQNLIEKFKVNGKQLFTPNAKK